MLSSTVPRSPARKLPVSKSRATAFEPLVAQAFGETVRALRVEQGDAQDAFALRANVDRSYYGKLERGERQPSLALLLRISTQLGISGGALVEHTEVTLRRLKRLAR